MADKNGLVAGTRKKRCGLPLNVELAFVCSGSILLCLALSWLVLLKSIWFAFVFKFGCCHGVFYYVPATLFCSAVRPDAAAATIRSRKCFGATAAEHLGATDDRFTCGIILGHSFWGVSWAASRIRSGPSFSWIASGLSFSRVVPGPGHSDDPSGDGHGRLRESLDWHCLSVRHHTTHPGWGLGGCSGRDHFGFPEGGYCQDPACWSCVEGRRPPLSASGHALVDRAWPRTWAGFRSASVWPSATPVAEWQLIVLYKQQTRMD